MKLSTKLWILAGLALCVGSILYQNSVEDACNAKGGYLVKARFSPVCIHASAVIK